MRGRLALGAASGLAVVGAAVAVALPGGGSKPAPVHVRRAAPHAAARRAVKPRVHRPRAHPKPIYATSTPPASQSRCHKAPPPVPEHPITHRQWLGGVTITEYY